ncbi:hypothetical protein B4134_1326 [Bacillus safensis]|nr:hypothetical protein B4134_1326 [Bacillus safensis]
MFLYVTFVIIIRLSVIEVKHFSLIFKRFHLLSEKKRKGKPFSKELLFLF